MLNPAKWRDGKREAQSPNKMDHTLICYNTVFILKDGFHHSFSKALSPTDCLKHSK